MFGVELKGSLTRQTVSISLLLKCWVPGDLLTVAFKCQKKASEYMVVSRE